ncbi:MAG: alpha/beta hydrolase [Planctomycetota bacterium]
MPTLQTSLGTVAFDDNGKGKAVCLVHGFPLDRRVWAPVAERLGDEARVINVDLPGFGEAKPAKPCQIDSLAGALHEVLSELSALPVVLAGLSMGGYVALAYAAAFGDSLAGLALVDTRAAADDHEKRVGRDRMIQLVQREGTEAITNAMFDDMLAHPHDNTPAVHDLRNIMNHCPPHTIERALRAMKLREDRTDLLPTLDLPAVVIVGEHDRITPVDEAERMSAALPHGKLKVIPDAGHMAPLEQPDAVAEALRTLLV